MLPRADAAMDEVRMRLARGLVRGTVAAMAMTGVRQVTTGLGLVEQTPPDAIIKQRDPGLLVRTPRLLRGQASGRARRTRPLVLWCGRRGCLRHASRFGAPPQRVGRHRLRSLYHAGVRARYSPHPRARQVQEDQTHRAAHVHRRPPALRLDLGGRREASPAGEARALATLSGANMLLPPGC